MRQVGLLGLNRASVAVLVAIAGMGFSEEIWRHYLGIELKTTTDDILAAAAYLAVYSTILNLLEGLAYIAGGAVAHRWGARWALAASAAPMIGGFALMLAVREPWARIVGALMITNWEPLSVPAAFEVVGAELPSNRRTIAFAMQSIQKRIPKILGPLVGAWVFAYGYEMNLALGLGVLAAALGIQILLLKRMRPKPAADASIRISIPPRLKSLLNAEILVRWGDWFVRDFAALYVVGVLMRSPMEYGSLAALSAFTALVTYIPVALWADRVANPKPFIGLTFFLFALFPICLVGLPMLGLPPLPALVAAFVVNGLREIGEPARKALIAGGFTSDVRARAVGLYWGLRSLAFFPAPIVSYLLWSQLGPEATFLIGGGIGMLGTLVLCRSEI